MMKERPAKEYKTKTKRLPMVGSMAVESARRRTAWLKTGCNSFDGKDAVSKPMSLWLETDVLEYTKRFNLPLALVYGDIVQGKDGKYKTTGMSRTGCMFCPIGCHLDKGKRFKEMQKTHPKQWGFVMRDEKDGGLGLGRFLDFLGVEYKN
jgi:3'-phosphoadenosine 5'-phosphosulfate sulfotransferase (PAPS reductase)/FAD synthetase